MVCEVVQTNFVPTPVAVPGARLLLNPPRAPEGQTKVKESPTALLVILASTLAGNVVSTVRLHELSAPFAVLPSRSTALVAAKTASPPKAATITATAPIRYAFPPFPRILFLPPRLLGPRNF